MTRWTAVAAALALTYCLAVLLAPAPQADNLTSFAALPAVAAAAAVGLRGGLATAVALTLLNLWRYPEQTLSTAGATKGAVLFALVVGAAWLRYRELAAKAQARTLANLRGDVERRAGQAEQLAATLAKVASAATAEEALQRLLLGAIALLGGTGGTARLWDAERKTRWLTLNVRDNGPVEHDLSRRPLAPGSFGAKLIAGGPPMLIADFRKLDPQGYIHFESMSQRGVRSGVAVAIQADGEPLGTLDVHHVQPDYFTEADLALARALAVQAGAAIARVQAHEALRLQAQVLAAVGQAVIACDMAGRITYWNQAADALYGWPAAEALGQDISMLVPQEVREHGQALMSRLSQGEPFNGEFLVQNRKGESFYVLAANTPLYDGRGNQIGILSVSANLTDRKRAEVEALVANERLRTALEEVTKREATIVQQAEELRLLNDFARAVSSSLDLESILNVVTGPLMTVLGATRVNVARAEPDSGQLRIEAVRWAGEENGTPAGTLLDPEQSAAGRVVRTGTSLTVQDNRQSDLSVVRGSVEQGSMATISVPIFVGARTWGALTAFFGEVNGATPERVQFLTDVAAHVAVAIQNAGLFADLQRTNAELQATQAQVVQQERLRALGQMAAGVAHDLNNALAPVVGFIELLRTVPAMRDSETQRERLLDLIHTGAQDAAEVVRRLREFYRPNEERDRSAAVDLPQLLLQVVELTQPKWKDEARAEGRSISVETDLPGERLPPLVGDFAALREALTNLILNAVDALPRAGSIRLRLRGEGAHAIIEVADTGVGMTEEVRRRCLEPFFTSKGERGTGLGLSLVYGTVQRHGGTIKIESALGVGTTVRLRLPLALPDGQRPTPSEGADGNGSIHRPARPLHVLVVDDDPAVLDVTRAYLTADGHSVEVAAGGREALERCRTGAFDLAVVDRSMPDVPGDELAAVLKRRDPHLPVLLLTGFGDLMLAAGERPPGVDLVLGKPASLSALRAAVTQLTTPPAS